eukprot:m.73736 g.73736  ORF g.73736 m.73736 type:complete len:61 (-) comp8427_c0_seq1:19-201(-)
MLQSLDAVKMSTILIDPVSKGRASICITELAAILPTNKTNTQTEDEPNNTTTHQQHIVYT